MHDDRSQGPSRPRKRVWVQNVAVSATVLQVQLDAVGRRLAPAPGSETEATLAGIGTLLDRAREAAHRQNPIPTRWEMWWRGTLIEAAYQNLHAAESMLVRLYDDAEVEAEMPEAVARVEAGLHQNDRRRVEAARALRMPPGPRKRVELGKLVEIGYAAADRQHSRLRSFRNTTLRATALLSLFAGVFVLVVSIWPEAVPLCFQPGEPAGTTYCPSGGAGPSSADIVVVAGLGLLGASIAAAVAIRNLRGTSTPYDLPVALAVLKVPFGVLTALGGIIAFRGEFVPGLSSLDSQGQILAYSLLFGYAQQLLTGQIDRQAQSLLQHVPSKDTSGERPETVPAAGADAVPVAVVAPAAGSPA